MEIGKIKDNINQEIQYQQNLTSKLGKYLTCFDYTDKFLTVFLLYFLEQTFLHMLKGRKQLLGLITSVFSLISCLGSGIIKKLQQETKLRKKKHNRLLYLAKDKLDCVEMLISNSIKNRFIDRNEILAIMKEKKTMIVTKMKVIRVNQVKLKLFKKINIRGKAISYVKSDLPCKFIFLSFCKHYKQCFLLLLIHGKKKWCRSDNC